MARYTLYTYVADKDELLSAMYDHVLATAGSVLQVEAGDPRRELTAFFTAAYRLMVEYSDLVRLVRPTSEGADFDLTTSPTGQMKPTPKRCYAPTSSMDSSTRTATRLDLQR